MFIKAVKFISEACMAVGKVIGTLVEKTTKLILIKIKKKEEEPTIDDIKDTEKTASDIGYAFMMLTAVTLMWILLHLKSVVTTLTIIALADIAIVISKFIQFLKNEKMTC